MSYSYTTNQKETTEQLHARIIAKETDNDTETAQAMLEDGDYMILTDEEANDKATENIRGTLWAFNSSFLSGFTGFDESIFQAIADNGKYEDNNQAIFQLIGPDNIESFIDEAILADGRAHFLNTYDDNETEVSVTDEDTKEQYSLYVYRIN